MGCHVLLNNKLFGENIISEAGRLQGDRFFNGILYNHFNKDTKYFWSLILKEDDDMKNIWLNGIMGVVVGDALGCPVQFMDREELKAGPVTDMEGYGTFDMPEGTWTDDSSLTLAFLTSIREKQTIDLEDIMYRFADWLENGKYTPYGHSFDIGNATMRSIIRYLKDRDITTCGGRTERDNGNGSLMRIMPACIYAYEKNLEDEEAIQIIHDVAGLTHNHLRGKIACGLYYFCVKAILNEDGELTDRIQKGIDQGVQHYGENTACAKELSFYSRLFSLDEFAKLPEDEIKSSGYVVDTIEAAIWALVTTGSFKEAELKAVNLADDADTVGAIAGGLAGLYYGYENIPADWLEVIKRREWIEDLCLDVLNR